MDYGNLDKMKEAWKNRQDPETCTHEWDYMVLQNPNGGNAFIEICPKCFDTKGIIENTYID